VEDIPRLKPGPEPVIESSKAAKLIAEYRGGGNPLDMAKRLGVHRMTLMRFMRANGLQQKDVHPEGRPRISEDIEDVIVKDYLAGKGGTTLLGRKHEVDKITVRNILKRRGVYKKD
jgi:hypothetical protein